MANWPHSIPHLPYTRASRMVYTHPLDFQPDLSCVGTRACLYVASTGIYVQACLVDQHWALIRFAVYEFFYLVVSSTSGYIQDKSVVPGYSFLPPPSSRVYVRGDYTTILIIPKLECRHPLGVLQMLFDNGWTPHHPTAYTTALVQNQPEVGIVIP